MEFQPVYASKHIVQNYKRYLRTIFRIEDEDYRRQFEELVNDDRSFANGPYLDVTDSFVKGSSIQQLIDEGFLPRSFSKVDIPLNRPLYLHQEEAIRKSSMGENVIVSTGTGSGKTESFLIPIFRHLMQEVEKKTISPGIRALLIYPMNALANDQTEKLRKYLANIPQLTFGTYTGQTKEKRDDALRDYKSLNNGLLPLPNELISREEMKKTPPNILITNYSMLEYLMLRPNDNVFFHGKDAQMWKYIVLDEAHVYYGSTGIEVGMLMRRLKTILDQKHPIQYILTSATLGDKDSDEDVARFGTDLCASPFSTNSIIRAHRVKHNRSDATSKIDIEFYREIASLINDGMDGDAILDAIKDRDHRCDCYDNFHEALYHLILNDTNYWLIKDALDQPRKLPEIANLIEWNEQDIAHFVTVATKAEKDQIRLFDARYHLFLRASDGVFITLPPSKKLFLDRRKKYIDQDGVEYAVFEIATCTFCHAIHLVGVDKGQSQLLPSTLAETHTDSIAYLLEDILSDTDEDHTLEDEKMEAAQYQVCSQCGVITRRGGSSCSCQHPIQYQVPVIRLQSKVENGHVTKCVKCENVNSVGILRPFFTGQEAVTSVIGTSLFEELPYIETHRKRPNLKSNDDDFGFGEVAQEFVEERNPKAAQFIAFSDNRQGAAFFSTYFDQTYRSILYRRIIIEVLSKIPPFRYKSMNEIAYQIENVMQKHQIEATEAERSREAWKAILSEVISNRGKTSLFGLGLMDIRLDDYSMTENQKLNLNKDEVVALFSVIALGIMQDGAIEYEKHITMNDTDKEFFVYHGHEYAYAETKETGSRLTKSFIPSKENLSNKRLDYLTKVIHKKGLTIDKDNTITILRKIWGRLISMGYLSPGHKAYKLDCEKILIGNANQVYRCNKCGSITTHNIKFVCPSYGCDGILQQIDPKEVFNENHYSHLYQELRISPLRVVEHTAQLGKKTAYEYQNKFKNKKIDVLSCSTTFEMGVDVGSLETVFMRNMPPSPSNYAQRAGRAGRSKQSAAFALTFCNRSSHDFTFFRNPTNMMKGRINPPKFNVENEKIAIRHLYAAAFSYFWRLYPIYYDDVKTMMEDNGGGNGYSQLKEYLRSKPSDLQAYAKRFLSKYLNNRLGIDTWEWVNHLIGDQIDSQGTMEKAVLEYHYELKRINEEIRRLQQSGERGSDALIDRRNLYQEEDILSFLSKKNVLPKYGFPVDTVELKIGGKGDSSGLELSRDLAQAIAEYAPSSEVVANGKLIVSEYIRKLPNLNWRKYDYFICDKCGTMNFDTSINAPQNDDIKCTHCHDSISRNQLSTFIVPEFGFEANASKISKPSLIKPKRSYRSETYYVDAALDKMPGETKYFEINGTEIELTDGRNEEMASVNRSDFFVCETCGYAKEAKNYAEQAFRVLKEKHKNVHGRQCSNIDLNKYNIGYEFRTDIIKLHFPSITSFDYDWWVSVLFALLRGTTRYLQVEESDISGVLQTHLGVNGFPDGTASFILYDTTPGGAGHVKRISQKNDVKSILVSAASLMKQCQCGGESGDSSCYSCLRSYSNQKMHERIKRGYAIDFFTRVFGMDYYNTNID